MRDPSRPVSPLARAAGPRRRSPTPRGPARASSPGDRPVAAGLAALSLGESILLTLAENGVINAAEAKAILADAAAAHRGAAVALADGVAGDHAAAAALLEAILPDSNAVRRAPTAPERDGNGGDPDAS